MDLVQLKTLVHVAELGSLSKTADRLNVAQPALSRQVRRLEAELGAALFIRHGRGMVPTELGRRVLALSAQVFAHIDEIHALARSSDESLLGPVRFGMTPTVAGIMTVPLIRAVQSAHPQLSLSLTTGFSDHLLDWLKRGVIDCCVAYDLRDMGLLRIRPILEETLFLVGDAQRKLSFDRPRAFASLTNERLLLPSPPHRLRRILDNYAHQAGVQLNPVIEADSHDALVDLVSQGFGLTILPLTLLHLQIATGQLSATFLEDPRPKRRVVMAYPVDRPLSAAARAVGELFTAEAIDLVNQGIWQGRTLDTSAA